ncbi:MAG TPA: Crp/Fnr family transcriptional regulator [Roseiflexaceae bacterium]|nr:Crp/Fnr family transcriptional regulator [Roseiflexaceae bacterium]
MDDRRNLLQRVSFCAGLPERAVMALESIAVPLQRAAGAVIQLEGDQADAMYVVASGRVKIARIGANGREQVLNVIPAGGHFNTVPIFDGGLCPANAEALDDVDLLALPRDALLGVVERHPALALALLREFTGRLRHLVNLVDELALHSVQGRLAGLLLAQAEAAERGQAVPALTQAEMAAQLGTVREMIGRTLKGFETLGLIRLDRGQITILNQAGLELQREQ